MIRVETLEEVRLLFNIITSDTPKRIKQKIYDIIEEFEENRSI